MATVSDISKDLKHHLLITPQDVGSATETSTTLFVSMKGAKRGQIIISAHLTDTKTAVCELVCATDAAGSAPSDVSGKTKTLTGATGTSLERIGSIDFRVEDLDIDNSKYFVGVDITTNQAGDDICAILIIDPSYKYDSLNP